MKVFFINNLRKESTKQKLILQFNPSSGTLRHRLGTNNPYSFEDLSPADFSSGDSSSEEGSGGNNT